MMHPVDTIKTRIHCQAIFNGPKNHNSAIQVARAVWATDGLAGFYRKIAPGILGSLATGATYFGVIESTKKWMDETYPNFGGHWAHFISGAIGDTLGSVIYVPCEVMKQRMQVQGSRKYWTSVVVKEGSRAKNGMPTYGYYSGMLQAGCSIWKEQGLTGLYSGYWSTLARDVPFAGLMSTGNREFSPIQISRVIVPLRGFIRRITRLQVQGATTRYKGWLDVLYKVWHVEGVKGLFRGGVPRITWYIPASALTFMVVEFLRDHHKLTSVSIDKTESSLQEIS